MDLFNDWLMFLSTINVVFLIFCCMELYFINGDLEDIRKSIKKINKQIKKRKVGK